MTRVRLSPFLLQIFSWFVFVSIPLIFLNQGRSFDHISNQSIYFYLLFCGLYISIFYINTELILPALLLKKKNYAYFSVIFLLFAVVYVVKPFDSLVNRPDNQNEPAGPGFKQGPPPLEYEHRRRPIDTDQGKPGPLARPEGPQMDNGGSIINLGHFDVTSTFIFIMIIGLGTAYKFMYQSHVFETRAIQAEAEKANAELSFLKAQINPHFLYNTLNNIYTLCVIGSDQAAESVMKLSKIMRYITDESDADYVPMEHEIECISNFIALQKLRLSKKVKLDYSVEGEAIGHKITPLILMTFIENVFKYGLSNHLATTLIIKITINDDKIILYTENQIFEHNKQGRKGVGLQNTRKRLDYLYPGKYQLIIADKDGFFYVKLMLPSN